MRMLFRRLSHTGLLLCVALGGSACGEKKTELGEGGSVVAGSAGPQGLRNA
ncbi:MAG: curli production assembly/transport component CsgG, partial [Acidovorax sp.]|nr:curli production assembly/transport component CsgG [Acidovorax sp.]